MPFVKSWTVVSFSVVYDATLWLQVLRVAGTGKRYVRCVTCGLAGTFAYLKVVTEICLHDKVFLRYESEDSFSTLH